MMAWIYPHLAKEQLTAYLATHTNVDSGRQYGVSHSTVANWRKRHHIAPFSQGAGKPSAVAAALLRSMRPGRWYAFAILHAMTRHSRQQVYTILHRMTNEGILTRRGTPRAWLWQRISTKKEAGNAI